MNLYLYVGNDPVDGIDPTGNAGTFSCDLGFITVGEAQAPKSGLWLRVVPALGCKFTYCLERPCSPTNPTCSASLPGAPVSIGVAASGSLTEGVCKLCFTVGAGVPSVFPFNVSFPITVGE
jgi:hypothetical protein